MKLVKFNDNVNNYLYLLITLVLILMGLLSTNIFSIIAFIISLIYFTRAKLIYIYVDLFFLLPFATIFKYSSNSTSFVTLLFIYCVLLIFVRQKQKIKVNKFILIGFSFVYYIFIVDALHLSINPTELIKHVIGVLFLYYVLRITDKELLKKIIISFGIGLYISSIIAQFAKYIPKFYIFVRQVGYDTLITNRFTGLNGDPNYYTICLIIALMGSLALYKEKKGYFILSLIFTSIFGFQTYSKSFLLVFVLCIVVIIANLLKVKKNRVLTISLIVIIVGVICLACTGYFTPVNLIFNRFMSTTNINELTTGRSYLWISYLNFIFDNISVLLFGTGLSAPLLNGMGPHNFYIELLYYFGVIGSMIWIIFVYFGYKACVMKSNHTLTIGKISVLLLVLLYFALQMLFSNELYFHIAYVYIICKYCEIYHVKEELKIK